MLSLLLLLLTESFQECRGETDRTVAGASSFKKRMRKDDFPIHHCQWTLKPFRQKRKSLHRLDPAPQYGDTLLVLSILRGGNVFQRHQHTLSERQRHTITKVKAATEQPKALVVTQKTVLLAMGSLLAALGLWYHRAIWISLFNKEKLQQSAVTTLSKLNDLPKVTSYTSYILGMALWEAAGLSTIPVETAAGMVFGWPDGFLLNAAGKLSGAAFAFWLGRSRILASTMEQQFSDNAFLQSIQATTRRDPLRTAFLLKFGPLPETIKNFGSAFLKPIQWWMFLLATVVHGWTFSALWTYLGVDTALRLEDAVGLLPPDRKLQILLALALVNGIAVSPLTMVMLMYNPSSAKMEKSGKSKEILRRTQ